jgi:hypothetical protein
MKSVGKFFVVVLAIGLGVAVGAMAEHWEINRYLKFALIGLAVSVPMQIFRMRQGKLTG